MNYSALIAVKGRNDKEAILETGWIIKENASSRLVTAYHYSKPPANKFVPPSIGITSLELSGNDKWLCLYENTHQEGIAAAQSCVPTLMIIKGTDKSDLLNEWWTLEA